MYKFKDNTGGKHWSQTALLFLDPLENELDLCYPPTYADFINDCETNRQLFGQALRAIMMDPSPFPYSYDEVEHYWSGVDEDVDANTDIKIQFCEHALSFIRQDSNLPPLERYKREQETYFKYCGGD